MWGYMRLCGNQEKKEGRWRLPRGLYSIFIESEDLSLSLSGRVSFQESRKPHQKTCKAQNFLALCIRTHFLHLWNFPMNTTKVGGGLSPHGLVIKFLLDLLCLVWNRNRTLSITLWGRIPSCEEKAKDFLGNHISQRWKYRQDMGRDRAG